VHLINRVGGIVLTCLPSQCIALAAMRDFVDTKPFGAVLTGLAAAATCYVAGSNDWRLIAWPSVVMSAYYLFFSAWESREKELSDRPTLSLSKMMRPGSGPPIRSISQPQPAQHSTLRQEA
jgi:hypothetical protein